MIAERHDRFVLEWNERRLAVVDRDVEAIIRTHTRDRKVAAWLHDTAKALAEIGATEEAINWAKQAAGFDQGHQAQEAAEYWCALLAEHHPDELLGARLEVFRRWPTSSTAAALHRAAGTTWEGYREEVLEQLQTRPREAVVFALQPLDDVQLAWDLAHSRGLQEASTWEELIKRYEVINPIAVLPVLSQLVERDLEQTGARYYKTAARRLQRMRRLAAGTQQAGEVEELISRLRRENRRRPRLQQEFDRASLPGVQ